MRIVVGVLGGRRFRIPKDGCVRFTADRVREAWMSILGDELQDAWVFDLFAGSGALGLEVLSRGVAEVTFVELNLSLLEALRVNIEMLGVVGRAKVHRGDVLRFVAGFEVGVFDVVFADFFYIIDVADRIVAFFRCQLFVCILSVEYPVGR